MNIVTKFLIYINIFFVILGLISISSGYPIFLIFFNAAVALFLWKSINMLSLEEEMSKPNRDDHRETF